MTKIAAADEILVEDQQLILETVQQRAESQSNQRSPSNEEGFGNGTGASDAVDDEVPATADSRSTQDQFVKLEEKASRNNEWISELEKNVPSQSTELVAPPTVPLTEVKTVSTDSDVSTITRDLADIPRKSLYPTLDESQSDSTHEKAKSGKAATMQAVSKPTIYEQKAKENEKTTNNSKRMVQEKAAKAPVYPASQSSNVDKKLDKEGEQKKNEVLKVGAGSPVQKDGKKEEGKKKETGNEAMDCPADAATGNSAEASQEIPARNELTLPGAYHMGTPNDFSDQMEGLRLQQAEERQVEPAPVPADTPADAPNLTAWIHGERNQNATSNSTSPTSSHQRVQVLEGTTVYEAQEERHDSTTSKGNKPEGSTTLSLPVMGAGVVILVSVVVVLILGLLGVFSNTNNTNTNTNSSTNSKPGEDVPLPHNSSIVVPEENMHIKSTLEQIKEEGVLKVIGFEEFFPFYYTDENGELTGFEYEISRAIAAAIFGTEDPPVEVVSDVTTTNVFSTLANGGAHLMLRTVSWTMERQVFQAQTKAGLDQAGVYIYDGTRLAGVPFYVKCAETFEHLGDCQGLKVCVGNQTTQLAMLQEALPSRNVAVLETHNLVFEAFMAGTCNTFVHESASIQEYVIRSMGYEGDYVISQKLFTRETAAIVSRSDDHQFSTFVHSVLHALFEAEKYNITRDTADLFPETHVFGDEYANMYNYAIKASGNYGEIYQPHLGPVLPRDSVVLNRLNDGSTGQMMTLKFGDISSKRGEVPLSDAMTTILERGVLRCGVRTGRPGFAITSEGDFAGMEIDYCCALSASLFGGSIDQIEYVAFETQEDGFQLLANGNVDVIGGVTWNLANLAHEPSTGLGYSFSSPYFYGFSKEEDNFALATRSEDHDWSSFVWWIASALVYAEEQGLGRFTSNSMPEVLLYGTEMKRIFRDAVLTVGSYGEMYERNLEALYPRGGRNMLNEAPNLGPQFASLPGLIDKPES